MADDVAVDQKDSDSTSERGGSYKALYEQVPNSLLVIAASLFPCIPFHDLRHSILTLPHSIEQERLKHRKLEQEHTSAMAKTDRRFQEEMRLRRQWKAKTAEYEAQVSSRSVSTLPWPE